MSPQEYPALPADALPVSVLDWSAYRPRPPSFSDLHSSLVAIIDLLQLFPVSIRLIEPIQVLFVAYNRVLSVCNLLIQVKETEPRTCHGAHLGRSGSGLGPPRVLCAF